MLSVCSIMCRSLELQGRSRANNGSRRRSQSDNDKLFEGGRVAASRLWLTVDTTDKCKAGKGRRIEALLASLPLLVLMATQGGYRKSVAAIDRWRVWHIEGADGGGAQES